MSTETSSTSGWHRPFGWHWPPWRQGRRWDRVAEFIRRLPSWDGRILTDALRRERAGTILWCPVFLGLGIAGFFALDEDPGLLVLGLAGLLTASCIAVSLIWHRVATPAFLLACLGIGFAMAFMRSAALDTPLLLWPTATVQVTGDVKLVEGEPGRRRMAILDIVQIEGLRANPAPARIRIAVGRNGAALRPGDRVSLSAKLFPLPRPTVPGGYDYGRSLWFEGVGATGIGYGEIQTIPHDPLFGQRLRIAIETLRGSIAAAIRTVLPGPSGGMAVALVIGDRSGIPKDVTTAFRISGLSHVISISGLHMSLIAGTTFWLVRALLSLWPALTIRLPVKKIAATAALVTASGYFLISGFDVATQRSFVMIAIMFFAILLDRPAISMRNVALAAILVLILAPEAVLSVSFQLSFLAVMALVAMFAALYENRSSDETGSGPKTPVGASVRFAQRATGAAVMTTLTAGLATAPVAAYHFQRLASYSLLANLLATPVIGILIMPMLLLSLVLMPFGLHDWPLWSAGIGIDLLIGIARWVSSLPGAEGIVPAMPLSAIMMISAGALVLLLCRTGLRYTGIGIAVAGFAVAAFPSHPAMVIDGEGKVVALRNSEGLLVLSDARKATFAARQWLARDGDAASPAAAARRSGFACDAQACVGTLEEVLPVSVVKSRAALDEECRRAAILITDFPVDRPCATPKIVIDRRALMRSGAHQLDLDGDGRLRVKTVRSESGNRPWVIEAQRAKRR
ncbi:competence protein ComEC [Rhodoligotrophos appendicifer]|uniref:ComEC/Rec2 family competence protein n=1 Tax=Rhodoligotrophos appendicifer TaxID=987056 RepID=UPI001184CBCC|nr:ComEC/Rec2 family competence protein [Rhodoligotrophos appendicifer]